MKYLTFPSIRFGTRSAPLGYFQWCWSLLIALVALPGISYAQLQLTATSPAPNARAAAANANIVRTFSAAVNAAAGTNAQVQVHSTRSKGLITRTGGGAVLSGGGTTTVTINPAQDFRPGETVQVTTLGTTTASAGGTIGQGKVSQFTVAAMWEHSRNMPACVLPPATARSAAAKAAST